MSKEAINILIFVLGLDNYQDYEDIGGAPIKTIIKAALKEIDYSIEDVLTPNNLVVYYPIELVTNNKPSFVGWALYKDENDATTYIVDEHRCGIWLFDSEFEYVWSK